MYDIKKIANEVEGELNARQMSRTSFGCLISLLQLLIPAPLFYYIIYSLIQDQSLIVFFWVWVGFSVMLTVLAGLGSVLLSRK